MFVNPVSKNIYTKIFNIKDKSFDKINEKNISEKKEEKKTFWESIQKLRPLVK